MLVFELRDSCHVQNTNIRLTEAGKENDMTWLVRFLAILFMISSTVIFLFGMGMINHFSNGIWLLLEFSLCLWGVVTGMIVLFYSRH